MHRKNLLENHLLHPHTHSIKKKSPLLRDVYLISGSSYALDTNSDNFSEIQKSLDLLTKFIDTAKIQMNHVEFFIWETSKCVRIAETLRFEVGVPITSSVETFISQDGMCIDSLHRATRLIRDGTFDCVLLGGCDSTTKSTIRQDESKIDGIPSEISIKEQEIYTFLSYTNAIAGQRMERDDVIKSGEKFELDALTSTIQNQKSGKYDKLFHAKRKFGGSCVLLGTKERLIEMGFTKGLKLSKITKMSIPHTSQTAIVSAFQIYKIYKSQPVDSFHIHESSAGHILSLIQKVAQMHSKESDRSYSPIQLSKLNLLGGSIAQGYSSTSQLLYTLLDCLHSPQIDSIISISNSKTSISLSSSLINL